MADQLQGLQGVTLGTRRVVSDVEGIFQLSFGINTNAFFYAFDPLERSVGGINIAISWTGGSDSIVNLDPLTTYYRNYPTDTLLTISVAETALYFAFQSTITIPAAGFRRIDIALQFKEAYARITKKRFL